MTQDSTSSPRLGKYLLIFTAAYAAFVILIAIVLTLFDAEGNSGTSIASLMGAAYMAAAKFVSDHKRRLTRGESIKLSALSLLASFVVTGLLLLGYLLFAGAPGEIQQLAAELGLALIIIVTAVVGSLSFFILWFFYNFASKTMYNVLVKKGKL